MQLLHLEIKIEVYPRGTRGSFTYVGGNEPRTIPK